MNGLDIFRWGLIRIVLVVGCLRWNWWSTCSSPPLWLNMFGAMWLISFGNFLLKETRTCPTTTITWNQLHTKEPLIKKHNTLCCIIGTYDQQWVNWAQSHAGTWIQALF